jgi:hypothetical protein
MKEETWWCVTCQQTYSTPLPASEVRCKKGHRMQKATTKEEIAMMKAREGVK